MMSEETRYLKEILNNQVIENYNLDDDECYLNGYARKCLNKVLEEIERLNKDFRILKELQMKTNEENNRLNNIINRAVKFINGNDWSIYYEISSCRTRLLQILRGDEDNE